MLFFKLILKISSGGINIYLYILYISYTCFYVYMYIKFVDTHKHADTENL